MSWWTYVGAYLLIGSLIAAFVAAICAILNQKDNKYSNTNYLSNDDRFMSVLLGAVWPVTIVGTILSGIWLGLFNVFKFVGLKAVNGFMTIKTKKVEKEQQKKLAAAQALAAETGNVDLNLEQVAQTQRMHWT